MASIQATLQASQEQLIQAGLVDSPKIDAELLLCHTLDVNRSYLFTWPEKELTAEQTHAFQNDLQLRLAGHPIAHIIGQREFWGLNLRVSNNTLIPRPDTETLIEAVLNLDGIKNKQAECTILDLGTGSGAIALALKSELPHCDITAIDQSQAALEIARENAISNQLDVQFMQSDWFSAIGQKQYHCIVSNPPYIEEDDPHLNQGDVRFEPLSALTSGEDGLDDIRLIINQAWSHLVSQGWLVIEHGYNQAESIAELFKETGFQNRTLCKDLGGNPRVSLGQKP
ncbi:release factor glutamine methyltransferase [Thiomicrorhabdus immobilis]|uniref:Release factor glutamine methyltransferase n=1 Tax=Thiomicrorhabdus immobilis TaxID=2791037 RepID=A0ABM7MBA9_9GAMM|nr:peptide chain release factor N(5)-glutamine methyltransferase [Thiomicrorhabdus immobilis]BCN92654.1 release factor glutamine methyltransferase [Thiomicrorhabdus immobilis]